MSAHPSDVPRPAGVSNDQPAAEDRLGIYAYVDALAEIIRQTRPPFTVGIYGRDGSGKSFFLHLLRERFKEAAPEKPAPADFDLPTIHFNTFDHPVELVGARLVYQVIRTLEDQLTTRQKIRLINRQNWRYYYQRVRGWLLPLLIAILALEILAVYWLVNRQVQLDWATIALVLGSGVVASAIGVVRALVNAAQDVFRAEDAYRASQPAGFWRLASGAPAPDPKREAAAVIEGLRQALHGRKGVLLIDLSNDADKVKEVLDWVELLQDAAVFVVAVALDPGKAAEAIDEQARKREAGLERIAAALEILARQTPRQPLQVGRAYLERHVQMPFYVPRPDLGTFHHYVDSLVGGAARDQEWEEFHRAVAFIGPNPRDIKRLISRYHASALLLTRLRRDLTPEMRAKMIRWLVFNLRWPDVANVLLDRLNRRDDSRSLPEDLRPWIQDIAADGIDAEDSPLLDRWLEESPSLTVRDYDDFLHLTLPFLSEAAWK